MNDKKNYSTTTWLAAGMLVIFLAGAGALLWPTSEAKGPTFRPERPHKTAEKARVVRTAKIAAPKEETGELPGDDSNEGDEQLVAVAGTDASLWVHERYENVFEYQGPLPGKEHYERKKKAQDEAAKLRGNVELQQKKLLEHYPEMEEKVAEMNARWSEEKRKFDETKMGPNDRAIANGLHLEK